MPLQNHAILIRPAVESDLASILEIYNYYIVNSTATFSTEPEVLDKWRYWLHEHIGPYPAIVAEVEGEVVGWGCLSRWHTRCAYRFTVENSVYVRHDRHGIGVGAALLSELLRLAREHGHHAVVAQIADHRVASERLHEKLGFRWVGCLEQVGYKFERWVDVVLWQTRL